MPRRKRKRPKWPAGRAIFRKNEPKQPAHVYAERFAKRFNLIITDGWRPPNVSYGSPTSWHKEGVAFDFYPYRYGLWGKLDRARAYIWAKMRRKTVEVLWRVAGHRPGDNPHLHVAFDPDDVIPSRRTY